MDRWLGTTSRERSYRASFTYGWSYFLGGIVAHFIWRWLHGPKVPPIGSREYKTEQGIHRGAQLLLALPCLWLSGKAWQRVVRKRGKVYLDSQEDPVPQFTRIPITPGPFGPLLGLGL